MPRHGSTCASRMPGQMDRPQACRSPDANRHLRAMRHSLPLLLHPLVLMLHLRSVPISPPQKTPHFCPSRPPRRFTRLRHRSRAPDVDPHAWIVIVFIRVVFDNGWFISDNTDRFYRAWILYENSTV